jgi:hypothetical protein
MADMSDQWIPAKAALEIIGNRFTLCTRLNRGLLVARAVSYHVDGNPQGQGLVPKEFWWAGGHEALEQDWASGDFSTWIDNRRHLQAFGVTIALTGLLELIEIERRPTVARSLSVAGNPAWVTANDAVLLGYEFLGPGASHPGHLIKEQASFGFVAAKAVAAKGVTPDNSIEMVWDEREWSIPTWFWQVLASKGGAEEDWVLGNFRGGRMTANGGELIVLSGVHFHRESLISVFGQPDGQEVSTSPRGRTKEYDWAAATISVSGLILRSELIPKKQADIEKAFIVALTKGDKEPSESSVRPYASRLWKEYNK